MKKILIIDINDKIIGFQDKLVAHQNAQLHRAFSVFILNSKNELLIQQRAHGKYHSGGLWSNTCCGHFTSENDMVNQAEKRLYEEMSLQIKLTWIFNYRYNVKFDDGLTENELVYAYLGYFDYDPIPDPEEVNDWKWVSMAWLVTDIKINSNLYSFWFKFSFDRFYQIITKNGIKS